MKNKKLILDTKKPLGKPNGIKMALGATLVLSIAVEYKVAPQLISAGNYSALACPFLLNIIPLGYPGWKWFQLHIINCRVYKALMTIVHAEQLVDYAKGDERTIFNMKKVLYGVRIIYEETSEGIYLTFYPNGIKHSDATRNLNSRLEESFNMNVLSVDHQLSYTRYLLRNVDKQRMGVTEDAF